MQDPAPPRHISSNQNSRVKALRRALAHAELVEGACGVDSEHLCREAVRSGLEMQTLFLSESRYARESALVPEFNPGEVLVLDDEVFASAVSTEKPTGVAALVCPPQWRTGTVLDLADALLVVCVGMQDPGNLGTIMRSAEAFGAAALILLAGTVSAFSAKMMRASAGSCFRLPTLAMRADEAISTLSAAGAKLVGADAHRGSPAARHDLRAKTAIFFGNEGFGIPKRPDGKIASIRRASPTAPKSNLSTPASPPRVLAATRLTVKPWRRKAKCQCLSPR